MKSEDRTLRNSTDPGYSLQIQKTAPPFSELKPVLDRSGPTPFLLVYELVEHLLGPALELPERATILHREIAIDCKKFLSEYCGCRVYKTHKQSHSDLWPRVVESLYPAVQRRLTLGISATRTGRNFLITDNKWLVHTLQLNNGLNCVLNTPFDLSGPEMTLMQQLAISYMHNLLRNNLYHSGESLLQDYLSYLKQWGVHLPDWDPGSQKYAQVRSFERLLKISEKPYQEHTGHRLITDPRYKKTGLRGFYLIRQLDFFRFLSDKGGVPLSEDCLEFLVNEGVLVSRYQSVNHVSCLALSKEWWHQQSRSSSSIEANNASVSSNSFNNALSTFA